MSTLHIKPKIGITTGDLNGVGIELILKTFTEHRLFELCTPIVFASNKAINFYKNISPKDNVQYTGTKDLNQLSGKGVQVFNCWEEEVKITPGEMNETGGKYGIRSLMVATQCLKDGQLDGLLTNPIHKHNSQTHDFKHSGHTPFLKEKFGAKDVAMMMCTDDLKVALLTEHIPISEISKHITTDNILSKVRIINESLIKDFGIDRPKIAVLALNPHASDNGLIGNEEQTQIIPAIEKLKAEGLLVYGPYSSDAFFARQSDKNFDCTLAMYHDQGLIPFKSFDHGLGVNFTAGLPVVRTSPDHGTAFDIAGKNMADASSFIEALYCCIDILNQRKGYAAATGNKLVRSKPNQRRGRERDEVVH